jgi:hypothetical protein
MKDAFKIKKDLKNFKNDKFGLIEEKPPSYR